MKIIAIWFAASVVLGIALGTIMHRHGEPPKPGHRWADEELRRLGLR